MTRRSISSERRLVCLAPLALPILLAACDPAEAPSQPAEEAACLEAEGLRRLGDPDGALARAEAILGGTPDSLCAHRAIQSALLDLDRADEARARYLELQRQHPRDAAYAYLAGRAELPDAEAARPWFERCAELDPDSAWCTIALARLEVLAGDRFEALQMHRAALDDEERDPVQELDLQLSAGFLYLELRLLRDAERSFAAVLSERPWDPMALGGMGQVQSLLGRDQEAIETLERAVAVDPSRTDLIGSLALARYGVGDLDGAWRAVTLQQEIDGSASPLLVRRLERELGRSMPVTVVLGPYYLTHEGAERSP